jgi:hypothetical protein
VGRLTPSVQTTRDPPPTLRNEDHWSKDDHVNSDLLVSDHPAAPGGDSSCSQSFPVDDLPMIDTAHQFPAGQHVWAEDVHHQSSFNTTLNTPEVSNYPAIASSSHDFWPPQQAPAIAAPQSLTGFYNPSLMPHPNNISYPNTSLMPHPNNINCITPSFYPPYPLSTPFLTSPIPTPRTPCPLCTESFARPNDLNRHWQSVHLGIKYHCDYWLGCPNNGGKGYCRLEKLRTHQREKHGFAWS